DYDLLLREALATEELAEVSPAVLTAEQVRGDVPLPEFLTAEPAGRLRIPGDAVWEAHYRHAYRLGGACEFLREWVGFEVALRNAVATARAETLELDPAGYLLGEDLADEDAPVQGTVAAWAEAPDPLAALRVLDEGRWTWVDQRSRYFSFAIDELAAYARKLILLTRWHVLSREEAADTANRGA
ncbi:hypothetical protein LCGC14_2135650, partial [marine sediment metagenome]